MTTTFEEFSKQSNSYTGGQWLGSLSRGGQAAAREIHKWYSSRRPTGRKDSDEGARLHYRMVLMGAGVKPEIANQIAGPGPVHVDIAPTGRR